MAMSLPFNVYVKRHSLICLLLLFITLLFSQSGSANCPCNIFSPSSTPASPNLNDGVSIEVGVKFRADVNGYITGIRFYKGTNNTGIHIGHLWSRNGTKLAEATFINETASGWQYVAFDNPVAITANTTYIASYFSAAGGYSTTNNYFTSAVTNEHLKALANGEDGTNGVYSYTSSPAMPVNSYQSSNYWVDVEFRTSLEPDRTPPAVTSVTPADGSTGVSINIGLLVYFSESVDPATVNNSTFQLKRGNVFVTADVEASAKQVTFAPAASLVNGAIYTATIKGGASGVKDMAGNPLASDYTWTFTTATTSPPATYTIFPPTGRPNTAVLNDRQAIELGMKFRVSESGSVTGVRFYKATNHTGAHIGHLWTETGTLLAEANFVNETDTGWQQVLFSSPVVIKANTTYVVSYFSSNGYYSSTNPYFTSAVVSGPVRALATGEAGGNGVYKYSPVSTFPTRNYQSSNYWVDVIFTTNTIRAQGNPGAPADDLFVTVRPNPTSTYFQLIYTGNNGLINVRIIDISGKILERHEGIARFDLLRIGEQLPAGMYFAEITQGNQRKTLKLVKTN